jgi:hypothetical protein
MRFCRRIMKLSPEELADEIAQRRRRFYHEYVVPMSGKGEIRTALSPGEPVTITLTKYNLPNNSALQKGQLN